MSHDDRAADVPAGFRAVFEPYGFSDADLLSLIRRLAAEGEAVVRVGEPPPWMERAVRGYVFQGDDQWLWTRGTPPNLTLYRLTEGNDRG